MHREAELWLIIGLVSRIMHATRTLFSYKNMIEGQGSIIAKKKKEYETKLELQVRLGSLIGSKNVILYC